MNAKPPVWKTALASFNDTEPTPDEHVNGHRTDDPPPVENSDDFYPNRVDAAAKSAFLAHENGRDHSGHAATSVAGLVVHRASEIQIEPIEWLWPGRLAIGKQTLIAGEAGLGKSQVSIAMAAAVTTGGQWPCDEGRAPPGSVVFLCAEDGAADTIVPRLMAAGADLDRCYILSAVRTDDGKGRRSFNLQTDLEMLAQKATEIGDARLVVIDPVSSYLGPKIDSHVNAAVRGVLEPLGEFADRLRVAILSITHPPKATGTAAINRFIGSVAFVAAARAAFMVTRDADDKDRRLFLPVKNNLAPLGDGLAFRLEQRIVGDDPGKSIVASSVVWESEPVQKTADEALQAVEDNAGGAEKGARDEAEKFLRDRLRGGPVSAKDIRQEANANCIAPRTLARAKKALSVTTSKGAFEGEGSGWNWSLPPEGCQPTPKDATLERWHPSDDLAPFDKSGGTS
jgi:putative DNA primase/helicase